MTVRRRVRRVSAAGVDERADTLAVEEPLEIRLGMHAGPRTATRPFSVTMRTPGHDVDLALGFLVGEGVVREASDVGAARPREGGSVEVLLAPGVPLPNPSAERHLYTTSACGVCGTASMEAVAKVSRFAVGGDDVRLPFPVLVGLAEELRRRQSVFERTGGLHAAGLFTADAEALCVREDVGRHNAVDKVVGWALREGRLPLAGHVLQVSGRASFELVQKAWLAGVPVLAAVSAPSSLAVELAESAGMTLVGFSRGDRCVVYTGGHRIT